MPRSQQIWLALIVLILAASGLAWWAIATASPQGQIAQVYVEGDLVKTLDLSRLDHPVRYEVQSAHGSNTVELRPDAVAIVAADCPDQHCVHQGAIQSSAIPIVCLPHQVVVRLSDGDLPAQEGGSDALDAIAR